MTPVPIRSHITGQLVIRETGEPSAAVRWAHVVCDFIACAFGVGCLVAAVLALACAIPARDGASPQSQIHEKG